MKSFFTSRNSVALKAFDFTTVLLCLASFAGFGQTSYTWQPSAGTSWANARNWSPARTNPSADDTLRFDGFVTKTAAVSLDFSASQSIRQLIFVNGINAALSTDADRTLTIGALPPTTGLLLEAGSQVQIIGTQGGNSALAIQLAENTKATIAGQLQFSGTATGSGNSTHTLTSGTGVIIGTDKAIEFVNGSYFKAGPNFSESPFGSLRNNTGTAVFRSGATCEQASGSSPFGSNTPQVAVFESGSTFLYTAELSNIGLSGHTFGNLIIDADRTAPTGSYGREKLVVQNNLVVKSGTHTFNVQNFDLQGDIILSGGNLVLTAVDNTSGLPVATTLSFNGLAPQVIKGTGTLALGPTVTLALNNAAGLALQRPLQINGTLTLTSGLLTTTPAGPLTLGPAATTSGGSAVSFVNGPLSRQLATTTATDLLFPIGSGAAYRPLTLRVQQTDVNTTAYTAQQFNQAPLARTYPTAAGSLQRVSKVRYFTVTNGGATNFAQGATTLSYDADDRVDAPAKLRLAKSDDATGNWLDLGGTGSAAPAGSITSAVPFASFGDFVLASTETNGTPGNNPLPVSLTGFTARRQAAGVRLDWATASERNNSRFEVQRSTDGLAFARAATMPGQGTSTAAHAYAWLDAGAPASGMLYYRLYQVDADGTGAYSPVVAVVAVLAEAGRTGVFPNPAHQQISFQAGADGAYRVLNVLGQPVLTGRATNGSNAASVVGLGPGAYYLEVVGTGGPARHRFIKE